MHIAVYRLSVPTSYVNILNQINPFIPFEELLLDIFLWGLIFNEVESVAVLSGQNKIFNAPLHVTHPDG